MVLAFSNEPIQNPFEVRRSLLRILFPFSFLEQLSIMRILSMRPLLNGTLIATLVVNVPVFAQSQDSTKKPERPTATAIRGTAKIDGEIEDAWKNAPEVEVKKIVKSETSMSESEVATAKVKLMWDNDCLYALWQVKDGKLSAKASDPWAQDSVELFVDELNEHAGPYQKDDAQYRVSFEGKISGDGAGYRSENVKAVTKKIDGGYLVEMSVKLSHAKRDGGTIMGLELQVNDDPNIGSRGGVSKWNHPENDSYMSTTHFGNVLLQAE